MNPPTPVVSYDAEGAIARIALNRPEALNSFDAAMRSELTKSLRRAADDSSVIAEMPKPVIAAVEGFVAGIGCAHVLASDLVVMAENAFLMLPFANIALVPDGGITWLLERRIGHRLAFEFAADAERIPAARCRELGLVNRVVPAGTAIEVATEWAGNLALRPPLALARTKQLLRECSSMSLVQAQEREAALQSECIDSADFREGVDAFLAKRPPKFTGR
jgi:2-(1,2-epoxy-1,2-dihydrophenyl)acetyl-CoA isomerase